MFPLHDNIPARSFPIVGAGIIVICGLVFFAQLQTGDRLVEEYGMVPARVTGDNVPLEIQHQVPVQMPNGQVGYVEKTRTIRPAAVPPALTLVTCMFLHGGWMHLLGNMWFLYVFGDNVEDRFGHVGFALMYLACGLVAGGAHMVSNPGSPVPTIGASGAIAGVMGAYLILYPRAQVLAVVPIVIVLYTMVVPAPVFLGIWFVIQLMQGVGSISAATGVAWWAHIGGFVAGVAITWIGKQGMLKPEVQEREEMNNGRYQFRH